VSAESGGTLPRVTELDARAARLLTVGFAGKIVDDDIGRLIDRGVGGVVLFSRNLGTAEEVAELTAALKRRAGRPLLVAIDQEGGRVARLRDGFTRLPPFRSVGRAGDAELAHELGAVVGRELAAVGVDWNYAPVLDVDTNPENPVIGDRSLGRDAVEVARLGIAFAAGLSAAGVAACAKHFPGHGDTQQDSHLALPYLPHTRERLDRVELVPFRAAAAANIPSIMTAHVVFEALERELPATMSTPVVRGILRDELRYRGVVVSDDLEMKAIADHFTIEDVVTHGLKAGVDAFLCCHTADLAHRAADAITRAVEGRQVPSERFGEAFGRVTALAERFARPPLERVDLSVLGCEAHRSLVERIERASSHD
jgi:beta-N-acetylhexosaminidase